MKVEALAKSTANFINRSKGAQKVLTYFNDNAALANAGLAAGLSIIARPLTMQCLNFKTTEDKRYSQSNSIVGGIVELLSTFSIFYFLNRGINKAADKLYDIPKNIFYHNKEGLRQFKNITNRVFKIAALVPISLIRFASVKPMVNLMFGRNKKVIEKTKKGVDKWG